LGPGLSHPVVPYAVVYQLEILALFATLAALGPLVARRWRADGGEREPAPAFGLADLPAVEEIRGAAAADGHRFSRLVVALVQSYPFRHVRNRDLPALP